MKVALVYASPRRWLNKRAADGLVEEAKLAAKKSAATINAAARTGNVEVTKKFVAGENKNGHGPIQNAAKLEEEDRRRQERLEGAQIGRASCRERV